MIEWGAACHSRHRRLQSSYHSRTGTTFVLFITVIQRTGYWPERRQLFGEIKAALALAKEYINTYRRLSEELKGHKVPPESIVMAMQHAREGWYVQMAKYDALKQKLRLHQNGTIIRPE